MAKNRFDKILRDKLINLSPMFNPSDWIIMERLLEWQGLTKSDEATDEVHFDEIAIDKLQNLAPGELAPDWDRMSAMLEQLDLDSEPDLEPSEFDQAINNKLKRFEAPFTEAAWAEMAPILDSDRMAPVQELDNIAKQKLTQISDIEPAWSTMSNKISRELFLPESMVKYKVVEVLLVLLFAISLYQFPLVDDFKEKVLQKDQITESNQINAPIQADAYADQKAPDDLAPIASISPEWSTNIEDAGLKIVLPSSPTNVKLQASIIPTYKDEVTLTSKVESKTEALIPSVSDFLSAINSEDLFSVKHSIYQGIVDDLPQLTIMTKLIQEAYYSFDVMHSDILASQNVEQEQASFEKIEVIDENPIQEIQAAVEKPRIACLTCGNRDQKVGLVLGLFSGSDYNQIVTPFDPIYALDGTKQWNFGYGGGLSVSMQFKSWELEMGAIYASNQYQPREILEIYSGSINSGYVASTLKDIELNIVKVPLNFRFNVNLKNKWKIYALSGATMNMVIQSSYITDDVFIGTRSFATPSAPVRSSDLSLKDFSGGILEGGSFSDNSFLTANLGLGVERTLNNKWSLFAQPTYQRQIFSNGIGPNQDRFNSLSLFFGTRLSLK
ncbi:MAG: outer membrane beta-barrel protein [Bacteroidia bacterium]|nr:outer membrane beta-barrel protein [Bacteroidia bacterium]